MDRMLDIIAIFSLLLAGSCSFHYAARKFA